MDRDGREKYLEAVKLAEEGNHEAALTQLEAYLKDHPADGEALNDAGTILFCLHRGKEAIDYFQKARNLCQGEKLTQVYWNLCEAAIAEARPEIALDLLDRMERAQILNADILNRLATIYVDREDCGAAMDLLCRSLALSPDQEVLRPIMEIVRNKRHTLTLAGHTEHLPADLVEFFRMRYPGSVCRTNQPAEVRQAMGAAGILLYFGADGTLRDLTRGAKTHKIIIRLGLQDLYHPVLTEINWGHVDALIVPDEQARRYFIEYLDVIPAGLQIAAVGPGVETESVLFTQRPRGKKVAAIGPWDAGANPMLLLQCIRKMHEEDEDMRFYLAGEFTDPAVENYMLDLIEKLELDDCVFLDGRPRSWNRWLRDKHYVVSAAVDARSMAGVYRAMAAGLKPVVHCFPGAEQYIGEEFLFLTPEEFCERIAGEAYVPEAYRAFAMERCSRQRELRGLDEVVRAIEKQAGRVTSRNSAVGPAKASLIEAPYGQVYPTEMPPVQKVYTPQPNDYGGSAAPGGLTRSIEEIAMEALNTARRLSETGGEDRGNGPTTEGELHGPF